MPPECCTTMLRYYTELMSTRLIVKNLPSNCTEAEVRKFFQKYGQISDSSLKYTKEGKFRGFAFVGFLEESSAKNALEKTNQTFMGSKKLVVEVCRPFGDANKPRAWSKYAKDSSAYKRANGETNVEINEPTSSNDEPAAKKSKKDEKFEQFLEAKGVAVEKEVKITKEKSVEDKKLMAELLEGIEGDTSLSLIFGGLPSSVKMKNIKEWLNPIRIKAMKISTNDKNAAAFVSFNRPPDVRRALQKDGEFLGGYKISIQKVEEPEESSKEPAINYGAEYLDRKKEEETVREKILETGRLFLRNLPYATSEDDLQYLFKRYGEITEVQVIISKTEGKCKGFAIVEYVFPESAVAAYSALDGYVFKGRMMHILPGDEKREDPNKKKDDEGEEDGEKKEKPKKKSFKDEKDEQKKKDANKAHSWNALFLGPNAIADTLAERLNVSKSDLLTSENGESAGVRMALAETRLVRETRDFFIENGIKLDAFSKPATKRSDVVLLAKNLPAKVEPEELNRMFEKYGNVEKVLMPPEGGVSALIIMGNSVDAKKAFKALAYSRFRNQPLYLEWAPYDAIENKGSDEKKDKKQKKVDNEEKVKKSKREMTYEERKAERKKRQAGEDEEEGEAQDEEEEDEEEAMETEQSSSEKTTQPEKRDEERAIEPGSAIFVKNLSFDTTDESLDRFFRKRYGDAIKSAQISKKLNPAEPTKNLSMGFGFVQFYTAERAMVALKEMQGELLEGHSLDLKLSERETIDKGALKRKDVGNKEQGESTKLLVRNLPFEASAKEVTSLFETFGSVRNIRIPRKLGMKNQHRGFGFVDFMSVDEAKRAFEALVHSTHLYGRRLVLEWAKDDETVEEIREKTAGKFAGEKANKITKKKAQMEQLQQELQNADDEDEDD